VKIIDTPINLSLKLVNVHTIVENVTYDGKRLHEAGKSRHTEAVSREVE